MPARPFTEEEYTRVIGFLADQRRHRDRLLVILACASGFRIKELLSLRYLQLYDVTSGEVAMDVTIPRRDLKGGRGRKKRSVRSRRVPLGESVRAAIADYVAKLPEPPRPHAAIFSTSRSRGRGMNVSSAFRMMVGAAEACGIDATRISTHSGRKTFARRMYAATDKDLFLTSRLMGHSSPVITARYLEADQAKLDEIVRSIVVT
jgi:integrase